MKRHRLLLILISISILTSLSSRAITAGEADVADVLARLDDELARRNEYIDVRQRSIDSLRAILSKDPGNLDVMRHMAERYTSFDNDSALTFYQRAFELATARGDKSRAVSFRISRASLLPLAGFIAEAQREFAAIPVDSLSEAERIDYYSGRRQMYSFLSALYSRFPKIARANLDEALDAQRHLIELLPTDSPRYLLNQGEYHYLTRQYAMAEGLLNELIRREGDDSNLSARANHMLADIARARGEEDNVVYYLAQSALSDTRMATREMTSLQELGQMMFQQGDIERSHKYLYTALRNAVECKAQTRMIQVAEAMPLIESVHQVELDASRRRIYIILGVIALTLLCLIVVLVVLRRKIRQMHRLQRHLEDANRTKDEYISQFLNLCSIYMDKLKQFCHIANRKISAGKVDDLYQLTKSGKFVDNQSAEFYLVFDNAFIHLHPHFVDGVNALLRPDEQIVLAPGETLNTDLRILAFMRLGIDDSGRIAQILNYSVNTIYAYRNKLKNRAISRDTFEADVMHIN